MRITKQDIDRISRRIKTQMKVYQKAVSGKHWSYLEEMVFSLLKGLSIFVALIARYLGGDMSSFRIRKSFWPSFTLSPLLRKVFFFKRI